MLAVLVLEQILVGAAAVRVFEKMDLRMLKTYRVLKDIVTIAANRGLDICVWISVPCTAGCSWRHINAKKGIVIGDIAAANILIDRRIAISDLMEQNGGKTIWD